VDDLDPFDEPAKPSLTAEPSSLSGKRGNKHLLVGKHLNLLVEVLAELNRHHTQSMIKVVKC
jgi:hypothetical protein